MARSDVVLAQLASKVKESSTPRIYFKVGLNIERQPFAHMCVQFLSKDGKATPSSEMVEFVMAAAFKAGILDQFIPRKTLKTFALAAYGEEFSGISARAPRKPRKSKAQKAIENVTGGESKLKEALDGATQ